MKRFLTFIISTVLLFAIYITVLDPIIFGKLLERESPFSDLRAQLVSMVNFNSDGDEEVSGGTSSVGGSGSSGGGGSGGSSVTPSNGINYVYYTQDKSVTGLTGACLLTSFAMLITNAGRIVGTPKEYGPVDVYLANNPEAKNKSSRRIISYYYVIADGFNHKWINVSNAKTMSASQREAKVKELLKTHPWGVIIGGVYGTDGTHYIAVRSDGNGGLLFDDPVKSRGPNLTSISQVYGINDWSKIRQIMTIEPNLDSNGKWKDGVYDKCKKNPSNCHVCATNVDC